MPIHIGSIYIPNVMTLISPSIAGNHWLGKIFHPKRYLLVRATSILPMIISVCLEDIIKLPNALISRESMIIPSILLTGSPIDIFTKAHSMVIGLHVLMNERFHVVELDINTSNTQTIAYTLISAIKKHFPNLVIILKLSGNHSIDSLRELHRRGIDIIRITGEINWTDKPSWQRTIDFPVIMGSESISGICDIRSCLETGASSVVFNPLAINGGPKELEKIVSVFG